MTDSLLRLPQVKLRTGLSKTEVYRQVKAGRFPAPTRVSHKVSVWSEEAIDAWVLQVVDPEAASLI